MPALKHAHIGITMGKHGSDVAHENADLIVSDDNFTSIVQSSIQGRIVYNKRSFTIVQDDNNIMTLKSCTKAHSFACINANAGKDFLP